MNRFTSNIDFSLTKKRLEMMDKRLSWVKRTSKSFFNILAFSVIAFLFCSKVNNDGLIQINNLDPKSFSEITLFEKTPSEELDKIRLVYNSNGELYTGSVRTFKKNDTVLILERTYVNGRITSVITHGENPYSGGAARGEFLYEDDLLISMRYFNSENILLDEFLRPSLANKATWLWKEWYPNGQLKFELYLNDDGNNQGLITLYNDQGDVLKQERYDNGKLIEKIK